MTTVSVPSGMTAPVMIRTAWHGPTRPENGLPAYAVPGMSYQRATSSGSESPAHA